MEKHHPHRLIVLVDDEGNFGCRHRTNNRTTDLVKTAAVFKRWNIHQEVIHFEEVDFRTQSYKNLPVLYQSSQDATLVYKGYIEDVLLGMQLQGARLIPPFECFRAHHNKVFMEILRDLSSSESIKSIRSRHFGSFKAFQQNKNEISYPAVFKAGAGDSSRSVFLANNNIQGEAVAKKVSRIQRSPLWQKWASLFNRRLRNSIHKNKFIVQNCIPNLTHDYKILAFGNKSFVVKRTNRKGDFRASGSPMPLQWPETLPSGMLDFAEDIREQFNAPFASLDVFPGAEGFHLGEIQFVRFGTKSLIKSPHHFTRRNGQWQCIKGASDWDEVLANSIAQYIQKRE